MASPGTWCARCHHLIVSGRSGWVHASDDDWAGQYSECPCISELRGCVPENHRHWSVVSTALADFFAPSANVG